MEEDLSPGPLLIYFAVLDYPYFTSVWRRHHLGWPIDESLDYSVLNEMIIIINILCQHCVPLH